MAAVAVPDRVAAQVGAHPRVLSVAAPKPVVAVRRSVNVAKNSTNKPQSLAASRCQRVTAILLSGCVAALRLLI